MIMRLLPGIMDPTCRRLLLELERDQLDSRFEYEQWLYDHRHELREIFRDSAYPTELIELICADRYLDERENEFETIKPISWPVAATPSGLSPTQNSPTRQPVRISERRTREVRAVKWSSDDTDAVMIALGVIAVVWLFAKVFL